MKIVVVVLNWNGKEDTLRCLTSLQQVTVEHSVIVVDNGSSDDSVASIQHAFPSVKVLESGTNLGYAEGNNVGIRHALNESPDAILILNNDTTVDPRILDAFMKRDLPIQGGKPLQMSDPSRLDHLGGAWNSAEGRFEMVGYKASAELWNEPVVLDYVCGVALFVKAEVFRRVGLFDPRFFLFWEECDWCVRAAKQGLKAQVCPEAILYHRGSASFVGGVPHTTYYWWRNRLLFLELHSSPPERRRVMRRIAKNLFLTLRRYLLKSLQQFFGRTTPERERKLKTYQAELTAVLDYYRRRFGQGPAWLSENRSRGRQ